MPKPPGLHQPGENEAEALRNIREAIGLYEEVLREDSEEVPADDYARAELAAA